GIRCYVRVSAGNMKGFGPATITNPPFCIPSSWREFSKTSRQSLCETKFTEILNRIKPDKISATTAEGQESPEMPNPSSTRQRRRSYGHIRKNVRQLLQLHPKLEKTMKRGLYLVSIVFNGDRMLISNEDMFPMVEVDENYGNNLLADFQWFIKLSFDWDELKTLRPNFERCGSATTFFLRMKLVQAAIELQMLLDMTNLGRLHHHFVRDNYETAAFVLICELHGDLRTCPVNLKWSSIARFREQIQETESNKKLTCIQQIADKLGDLINFYQSSVNRLDSGLYLAYLKMQNSVDSVRVMVDRRMPGMLPCAKIRNISNVSREEWEWLHQTSTDVSTSNGLDLVCSTSSVNEDSESSIMNIISFKQQFSQAAKQLCLMLNLPETRFSNSRIYDSQVVEVRDDLSLIILMSTADEVNVLSTPSMTRHIQENNFMFLPVYIFEILQHLSNNYRFISQYSRVSICLDFELLVAQQIQREAFSMTELEESKTRLNQLLNCQQDLDDIWRTSRWLVDVINCAKDKTYAGISLTSWLSLNNTSSTTTTTTTLHDEFRLKVGQLAANDAYASDSALDVLKFKSAPTTSSSLLLLPTLSTSMINTIPDNNHRTAMTNTIADTTTIMNSNNTNPITGDDKLFFLVTDTCLTHSDSGFIDNESSSERSRTSTISSTSSTNNHHTLPHAHDTVNDLTLYVPTTYSQKTESYLSPMAIVALRLRPLKTATCKDILNTIVIHVKTCHTFNKPTPQHLCPQQRFQPSSGSLIWTLNGREQILDEHLTAAELDRLLTRYGGRIHLKWIKLPTSPLPLSKSSTPIYSEINVTPDF
ncbi:unnamed protein product, partial [Didymodactylos carnosus]